MISGIDYPGPDRVKLTILAGMISIDIGDAGGDQIAADIVGEDLG